MKSFGSLWFQKQAAAWLALYVKLYIPIVLFGWILWFGQLLRVYRVFAQSGWISCSTYVSEWLKKMQTLCSLFKQQLDVLFSTLQPILQVKNKPIYFSEVAFPLSLLLFYNPPALPRRGELPDYSFHLQHLESCASSGSFGVGVGVCVRTTKPAVFVIPGTTSPQITHLHQPAFALVLQRHYVSVSHSMSLCFRGFMTLKSPKSVPIWS